MNRTLSRIFIHPIKSTAPIEVSSCEIQFRGLCQDRRMMLTDLDGRFLTARKTPEMVLIQSRQTANGFEFSAPGMTPLEIHFPIHPAGFRDVEIWNDKIFAYPASPEISAWFENFLKTPVQLVLMGPETKRTLSKEESGQEVTFVDKYPLLLLSRASLDDLNERLSKPVSIQHFRPNLVIDGGKPYEEDHWSRIEIGGITFRSGGLCARCTLINVDPSQGIPDPLGEPLKTLSGYRLMGKKVMFGLNLIPEKTGPLSAGAPVRILE